MSDLRNPFRLRAANRLERDDTFVSLFAPGILNVLDKEAFRGPPHVFRSAPGGGKTSLLRLFTPAALWAATRRKDVDPDLYQSLKAIGAIQDGRPAIHGVMLAVGRDMATLDDLPIERATRRRLFLAMATAKLVIEATRSAASVCAPEPVPLAQLQCLGPDSVSSIGEIEFPCTAERLFNWASAQETAIGDALDTYPLPSTFPGQDSLAIVRSLDASRILFDGQPVAKRTVIMIDDLQNLASAQRRTLLEDFSTARYQATIWLTERLAALDEQELLDVGALPDRDFSTVVLEETWISKKAAYRQALSDIASRRTKLSTVASIPDFAPCLEDRLNFRVDKGKHRRLVDSWTQWYYDRLAGNDQRAKTVVTALLGVGFVVDDWESLIKLRSTAILVERERVKSQSTFEFAADANIDSDVRGAAELFLCREAGLPFYCGFEKIAILSSGNIEQFLGLAGDMFERLAAKVLSRRASNLTVSEQDSLVRVVAARRLDELSQYVVHAADVKRILLAIGRACEERTYLPNAPYSPGVTGVGLRLSEWNRLRSASASMTETNKLLRSVIHSAISHNLIEISQPQRCKGDDWIIVRLNRILCPYFHLPLHRGQWRPASLRDLVTWIEQGYRTTQQQIVDV